MSNNNIPAYLQSGKLADLYTLLTEQQKEDLSDNVRLKVFLKGDIIYPENGEPLLLWCLLKGKVKMYKSGVGGRQQILRLYSPIQCFGYRAYFAQEPYVSTSAAMEDSTLATVPMDLVERFTMENNNVAMFFIRELACNLGGSDSRIVSLTQKHSRGRVAEALLLLRENYGLEEDGATLNICPSREELANLSNMTTANAIRTLSQMAEEKVVLVDGRRIKILNPKALAMIAKQG